jgi:acetyl esterase
VVARRGCPAVVLTCEVDVLQDERQAYTDRIALADIPVERLHYDGVMSGYLTVSGAVDRVATAHADLAAALDRLVS